MTDQEERLVSLSPEAIGDGDYVCFCRECLADTVWSNNAACGNPECCGPNLDFCLACGAT